jgi:hypothetical protein
MKLTFRTVAIASATAAVAALFSPGWSKQDGVSLSISKAEALTRVYVRGYPYRGGYARNEGVSWYAVRAYYWGGPWSGVGYSWAGWDDYAKQNGIGCRPGSVVKGGDGIDYNCQ